MKLISINIGRPRPVPHEGRVVSTGIFKEPVAGPVFLRLLNLDGDGQADLRVHGGADKAVYAYPFEHYAFWTGELGRDDFSHGQFGENFTITGWLEDTVCIGDEFQVGEARVQVTQPRSPCFKLGIRMHDDQFPARFAAANRTGFYLRVLREGRVAAGDTIERIAHDPNSLCVRDVFRLRHGSGTRDEYERAAKLPALSPSWRAVFEKRLAEAK
ncbi:MAG TPA: MOSC domain-containing protein [Sulfuricaulis sp.]|nr:MOSC domain-containing protein [Sulfuricaulis sp.]